MKNVFALLLLLFPCTCILNYFDTVRPYRSCTPRSTIWLSALSKKKCWNYVDFPHVSVIQGYCFINMIKEKRVSFWKGGTICSNSNPGVPFWYPFSECPLSKRKRSVPRFLVILWESHVRFGSILSVCHNICWENLHVGCWMFQISRPCAFRPISALIG